MRVQREMNILILLLNSFKDGGIIDSNVSKEVGWIILVGNTFCSGKLYSKNPC